MFKKTVTLSDLKANINSEFNNLEGEEAIQVLHRGSIPKVVLTQWRYLELVKAVDPDLDF